MEDDTKPLDTETPAPTPTPSPAPIGPVMDVMPPTATRPADSSAPSVEQEPTQPAVPKTQPESKVAEPAKTSNQKPGPMASKPHTAPVAAIVMAVLTFLVLAGLAYYAYSKG